ncbi:MAG: H(+)/Cl(-) exchange transporter ClcA [Reyranellaceae bacterium]
MSDAVLYWLAGACGFATGVLGAAFHLAVDRLFEWPQRLVERLDYGPTTIAIGAAVGAAMVLVAFLLTRHLAPEAAGSGVPEVEGALEGLRTVHWRRVLPVKFLGGLLALSSGLVGGREGPTIHMGASIGAFLVERLRLGKSDLHTLLAAGAAAGLSAAFNAPLAAVLFVIEETRKQFSYTFRSYVAVIAASAASAFGMELVGGTAPPLLLATTGLPLPVVPSFMVLGALLGLLGVAFNRSLVLAMDTTASVFRRAPFVYALLVGAAAGTLAIVMPVAVGGGERLMPGLVTANLPLRVLAVIALMRFVGTIVSYPVGVPSGIFAPLLTLATAVGLLLGTAADLAIDRLGLPVPPLLPAAFAVAAMGGLFSATVRAPLVGVVLVVELTGAFELILPIMVTCVTAHVVAEALGGRPIYEVLLERALRREGAAPRPPRPPGASSPVGIDERS